MIHTSSYVFLLYHGDGQLDQLLVALVPQSRHFLRSQLLEVVFDHAEDQFDGVVTKRIQVNMIIPLQQQKMTDQQ